MSNAALCLVAVSAALSACGGNTRDFGGKQGAGGSIGGGGATQGGTSQGGASAHAGDRPSGGSSGELGGGGVTVTAGDGGAAGELASAGSGGEQPAIAGAGGEAGDLGASECTTGAKQCVGNAVQECVAGAWAEPLACAAATPVCTGAGVCGPPPSCKGLADTCGPGANAACCSSSIVPGGTFDRSNDANYPATVSDFRLDTYEVTVGRYRKFVSAYAQNMISNGAGKNPNNVSDPGWDGTWNALLPADAVALRTALKCSGTTWTDAAGSNENLPASCMTWYEANAFCIWDGGRLPTQTEWNYAAAGGSEQRQYPWSSPAGSVAIDCSYANYMGVSAGTDYCVSPGVGAPNRVGSESPKGDGKWGQADLSGNVDEWVIDWLGTYKNPCNNCINFATGIGRVLAGSAFNHSASALLTSYQGGNHDPSGRSANFGLRCARLP